MIFVSSHPFSLRPIAKPLLVMAITIIRHPPDPSTFTPLEQIQAQAPENLSELQVLHYSSDVEVVFTPSSASPFQSSTVKVYVTSQYSQL